MVRAQIPRYISRPKYTRQSPDCPLVIFSFTALPSCLHCSTQYSSAFAQHCIVARPPLSTSCTRVHPHRLYYPRVSPSDPVSLLQVRPLPTISSESQQVPSGVRLMYGATTWSPCRPGMRKPGRRLSFVSQPLAGVISPSSGAIRLRPPTGNLVAW